MLTQRTFAKICATSETAIVAVPSRETIIVSVGLPFNAFKLSIEVLMTETVAFKTGEIVSFVALSAVK